MKRVAFLATTLAALFLTQAAASADGYRDKSRMHREPGVWTGQFRHMARHHHDWGWRHAAMAGYRAGHYGSGYSEPDADEDYGAASPYGDPAYGYPAYGYPAYAGYSGCGGCGAVYSGCYSYGCRPASWGYGYFGGGCGGCGGFLGYSRCGGC